MKILALDTSTNACSAALLLDDQVFEHFEIAPRRHSEIILPVIAQLLKDHQLELPQLDAIGFAAGPGSFMGIRLATGVAQGLAFAAKLPIVSISTLQALAQVAFTRYKTTKVLAAWDARMREIYYGGYELNEVGIMESILEDQLSIPQNIIFPESVNDWFAVGNAWQEYKEELSADLLARFAQIDTTLYPHASAVAQIAAYYFKQDKTISALEVEPIYLRNQVTEVGG